MSIQKKVVGFDLDGTLLKGNSSFAFSLYLLRHRIFSYKDMYHIFYYYFRHKFLGLSLSKLHKVLFKKLFYGKQISLFQDHIDLFVKEWLGKSSYPPAIAQLRAFQQNQDSVAIFSNSPGFLVTAIAKELGIEDVYATSYGVDTQGKLSNIVAILEGNQKAVLLHELASSVNSKHIIAFSDSILDLPFLQCATDAVAVQPGRSLKRVAKKRGWQII